MKIHRIFLTVSILNQDTHSLNDHSLGHRYTIHLYVDVSSTAVIIGGCRGNLMADYVFWSESSWSNQGFWIWLLISALMSCTLTINATVKQTRQIEQRDGTQRICAVKLHCHVSIFDVLYIVKKEVCQMHHCNINYNSSYFWERIKNSSSYMDK